MRLDDIQEQEMILRFDRVVWTVVHRFANRAQLGRTVTKDDLHQEGLIVLLKHIRTANDECELKELPLMDMWNAMTRLVISDQPISYPKTRTSDFTKIMEELGDTVDYSELENQEIHEYGVEEVEARMNMELFAKTLKKLKREIFLLRMKGTSQVDIAHKLGLSNAKVTRELKAIRHMYAEFAA